MKEPTDKGFVHQPRISAKVAISSKLQSIAKQVHYSRLDIMGRRERVDKSNQAQGSFPGNTTSRDYTGIYLADGTKLWYE